MQAANKHFTKIFFSLLGIGSLIWFLVRVIPKPSRAAYPCMRVAAPLASTFVLWLLGFGTSFLFLKRARFFMRQSRYATAIACLIAGGIAGGIFLSMPHSRAAAAVTPNAPIGVAKGANPGRVVWVHDSTVSNWAGLGDGHWWQSNHTSQAVVDKMLSRNLRELSGKATDIAAWDTLFRYFNCTHGRVNAGYAAGEKIAIKINQTFCTSIPDFCCVDSMTYALNKKLDYMNTSPQVVRALLRQLVNVVGVAQSDISVGDPTGYYPNEYHDSCYAEFPNVHYVDHAGKFGRTKAEFSKMPLYWSCRPTGVTQDYIPKHDSAATYFINLANMKTHSSAGITTCAKNNYGSLIRHPSDSGYYSLHLSLADVMPQTGNYRAIVDLMGHAHLGGKTLLFLVDGLYEGDHNNDTVPDKWPIAPFNGGWTSSMFSSQDPVAIESVIFDILQLDPNPNTNAKIAGAEDYLHEAAQANNPPSGTFYDPNHANPTTRLSSLGVCEHWNNATDRKYSRNLGTGNGIELVFINGATTGILTANSSASVASSYSLNYLSTSSRIEFSVPSTNRITLSLFDLKGKMQGVVFDKQVNAGHYSVDVTANTLSGKTIAPGMYVLALYRNENGKNLLAATCKIQVTGK